MNAERDANSTSLSLLNRVRRNDVDAWFRLTTLYSPIVYSWCRRAGLQDNDASDAVQEVFRTVFQRLAQFRGSEREGGSFRGWLWTISRNQVLLNYRNRGKQPQAFGGSDAKLLFAEQTDGASNFDDDEPDAANTRCRILHRALDLVKGDFNTVTWQAFSRVTLQDHSIQDVARDLKLTENAVRQAKFRVLRRLREELDGGL